MLMNKDIIEKEKEKKKAIVLYFLLIKLYIIIHYTKHC